MFEADDSPSAFASQGTEAFPPTYSDNLDVRNFSDENKWPVKKLLGRLALYHEFLKRTDIMPRARETGRRIFQHLEFELNYKEGVYDLAHFLNQDMEQTQPLDLSKLKEMLDEE